MSARRAYRRPAALLALPLTAVVVAACGNGTSTDGGSAGEGGEVEISGISQELIEAAQAEGQVTLYAGGHQQETVERIQRNMRDLFGIEVTYNREEAGAIANALAAELASGTVNADVVSLTDTATMTAWAEDGVLAEAELPNADDIIDGLDDPSTPQVPYSTVPLGLMYNSANTDADSLPTTWEELAAEGEGTIVTGDPNSSGTAQAFYTMVDKLYGDEFIDQLAQREVIVTDSVLALAQLVLTGEADIGVPAIESAVIAAADQGEPLEITFMEDGVPTFNSDIAVLADAPHPNAAKLLVQYHLSPEFQEELTENGGRTVLQDGPQPADAADLSDATLLSVTLEEITGRGQEVSARFAQAFNR